MTAERPPFPFRIFLPLVQLLACLGLLWPHLPALSSQLKLAVREFSARVLGTEPMADSTEIMLDVTAIDRRRDQPLDLDAVRMTAPAALNIPVGFIQIPFMLDNPSRSEWTPPGMWIREWRAVSWPFVGMIFWWIAGRSLEGISAGVRYFAGPEKEEAARLYRLAPKLRPIEVAIGGALVVLGIGTCYVLTSGLLGLATDYVLAAGAALWVFLGLTIVIAGIVQWRVRRAERKERAAAVEAI
jgi:hypothetical protein